MSERNFLDVPEDSDAPYESLFLQADEEFRQFVKTLADDPQARQLKSKSIKPAPGFCVKLKDTSTGGKLFINVCHTPELPEPQDISDEELIHILGSDDPTTYRVPLSLGLPHEEVDKSGGPCTVYDVIINETFFRKISSNELFKTFLITVALDGIEEKYNAHPDRENYVVLKNKLYMGTMPDHCIQDRKGPLISELPTAQKQPTGSSGDDGDKGVCDNGGDDSNTLAWRGSAKVDLTRHTLPGQRDTLVARFSLPGLKSGSSLALDMGDDHVQLTSHEPKYTFDFYLPFSIDEDAAVAEFNTKHQVLTVTVPIVSRES
ncbi:PIH1 domain-containing protein 1-like isoform X2 [Dermacentor albipictus]|uniref:PIH1 domain-containing protein 1-like isoform X2 n=1 Tax=Dermacentor albipictus TaxID=60249 RepID=UPI0031FD082E